MARHISLDLVSVVLAAVMLGVPLTARPAAADFESPSHQLVQLSLEQLQEADKIYGDGSNTGPIFVEKFPWRGYLGIAAVIALAYGIMWLAEDPPSPCMVASAAYGTPMAGEIALLRFFRDAYLLRSPLGTAFVDVYYRGGGLVADYVARHEWAARTVRAVLWPVVLLAAVAILAPEVLAIVLTPLSFIFALGLLLLLHYRARRRQSGESALSFYRVQ